MLEFLTQYNQQVLKTVQSIFISLAVLAGANPSPIILPTQEIDLTPIHQEIRELGANISSVADFRTSLSSGITSSATTMTLSSFTSGSDSLVVGETYGFKIGGKEYVIGTASTNNQIVSMTRGVSRITGTTTVSAYQSSWGRATAVEMTDAPILIRTSNILGGKQNLENVIRYDSTVSTSTIASDNKNLVNTELLNYVAFNGAGVVNASTAVKGVVEIATQLEARASTATGGTSAVLVLPASIATSTYNSATASSTVVMTGYTGKVDFNFIATSTGLFANSVHTGTTTMATSTSYFTSGIRLIEIGKNMQVFTSNGTFTVPSGVTKVRVRVVGGGGPGGSVISGVTGAGSGGGGGGYAEKMVDVSATTTIGVTVGASASPGSNGNTSYFSTFLSATGGVAGAQGTPASSNVGTLGGVGSNGDVNGRGQSGGPAFINPGTDKLALGGQGGSSILGGGGYGASNSLAGTVATNGGDGGNYGGGGGGCVEGGSQACTGGLGAQGLVTVEW